MRLIRKKICRAIPELDRFSDEQCVRFVIAANSSAMWVALRWVVVAVVGCISICVAGIAFAIAIALLGHNASDAVLALVSVPFMFVSFVGLVGALLTRDWLLRHRVRTMIADCGSCVRCRYSLLGVPVGADMQVTCPECGTKREVDAALGELVADERGGKVFRPQGSRVDSIERERLRVRRKRTLRRGLIGCSCVAVVVAFVVACVYGFLVVQSRAAMNESNLQTAWEDARRAHAPTSAGTNQAAQEAEWTMFREALVLVKKVEAEVLLDTNLTGGLTGVWVDPDALREDAAARIDKQYGSGGSAKMRALLLAVVSRNREKGNADRLDIMRSLTSPIRPIILDATNSWVAPEVSAIPEVSATTSLDLMRMMLAVRARDQVEYLMAMDELIELARVLDKQDTLFDHLLVVRIRIEVAKLLVEHAGEFRDQSWLSAARTRLVALGEGPDTSEYYERWRTLDRVPLAKVFADIKVTTLAMGGKLPDQWQPFRPATSVKPLQIGTYWSNVRACDIAHDELIVQSKQEAWERKRVGASPSGLPLVDYSMTWSGMPISRRDQMILEMRRAQVRMAAAEFAMRNGRAAKDVTELADMLPTQRTAFDPFTNKPFEILTSETEDVVRVAAPSDGKPAAPK